MAFTQVNTGEHVGSVNGQIANSGIYVLPITMHPDARSRRTSSSSDRAAWSGVAAEP